MRRWRTFPRRLLLAVVAGLVAATAAYLVVASGQSSERTAAVSATSPQAAPGDLVRGVVAALRHRHFYLSPSLRSRVDDAQQQAIERALTAHPERPPRYLVWLADTHDGGYRTDSDVAQQLAAALGDHALYVVVDERMQDNEATTAVGYDYVDPQLLLQRPADGLRDYAAAMGADVQARADRSSDRAGPIWGGVVLGLLLYGAIVLVVFVIGRIVSVRRRRVS